MTNSDKLKLAKRVITTIEGMGDEERAAVLSAVSALIGEASNG
jgi:hypothetical protein